MNAKTILSLTVFSAVTAASAAVKTANTLCRIEVASGTKSTIVAVPLVKVGGGNIPVTELVLTDNLTTGDTMLHWNGSSWDAWIIAKDQNGAKYWNPTVISEGSKYSTSAPAEGTALARGDAIWVNRANPTVTEGEVTRAKPFFIYGQVATVDSSVTLPEIVPGAYTMMGNTDLADKKISTLEFTGERQPGDGDKIVWSNSANGTGVTQYEYKGGNGWGSYKSTVVEKNGRKVISSVWTSVGDADVIPAGQGFWYVAK